MKEQGVYAPDATGTEATNLLKRNSDDVGWKYGVLVDASNKDKVKCKKARVSQLGIRYVYWPSFYTYCDSYIVVIYIYIVIYIIYI